MVELLDADVLMVTPTRFEFDTNVRVNHVAMKIREMLSDRLSDDNNAMTRFWPVYSPVLHIPGRDSIGGIIQICVDMVRNEVQSSLSLSLSTNIHQPRQLWNCDSSKIKHTHAEKSFRNVHILSHSL